MKSGLQQFLEDLHDFFTDLANLFNRGTFDKAFAGPWHNIHRDNYRKLPLILTVLLHLGIFLLAVFAPRFMGARPHKIPEVYTVDLYSAPKEADIPSPDPIIVKPIATPSKKMVTPKSTEKKITASAPVKREQISLSPIRQRLEKEMEEKKARKKQEELRLLRLERLRMNLLKEQTEKQAEEAEKALAEAKREAAGKIAELYRTSSYAADDREKPTGSINGAGNGGADTQKLEALDRYRARLFGHISPHWQLPELQEWDEDLRAIIVMDVNRDGTVNNSYFEKRSKDSRFNQYARKAIENAQPLPPFPIDFHEKREEIAVTFSPGGLF